MDYDVIVIGAGHNALVSAGYLSQAGYRVGVFEKRQQVGGAVSTQELIPGYQFDLGGSAHILIRLTPVVEELSLHRYGLQYIELDPLFYANNGKGSDLFIYRDEYRTAASLNDRHPGEGDAYLKFLSEWRPFAQAVRDAFLQTPSPLELGKSFALGPQMGMAWDRALPFIMQPYGDVVDRYFNSEELKTALVWMAAQSGPPPTEPLTAPFLLWHPLYHEGGIARPRGGSGMLSEALRLQIEDYGGHVHTSAPVEEIIVEGQRARGIRVGKEIYTSKYVLAGTHIMESMGRLLPPDKRPADMLDSMRVGNGFGAVLRVALSRPVRYASAPGNEARVGLQLLCKSRRQIQNAYADYLKGTPAEDPPIVAMTFSAVDDTLAPPGGEVLWIWGQYYPYELSHGRTWDQIEGEVAENLLNTFEMFAPGTKSAVVGELFQHPLWLERELGLYRGNVMHLEMSLDQMFTTRPHLRLSGYRTHIEGLYITGASTHPGGGIMGASGRNAACVILKDLSSHKT